MLLSMPRVPEVFTGMALSAATLNAYHRGLQYLLGVSHEDRVAMSVPGSAYMNSGTYATMVSGYAPLVSMILAYDFWMTTDSATRDWWYKIQYLDGATWRDAVAEQTGEDLTHINSTVDLTGKTGIVANKIFQFRIQVKNDGTGQYNVFCDVWNLAIRKTTVTGWTAVPVFVNAAESAAAEINKIRTDLNALASWQTGYNHIQCAAQSSGGYAGSVNWHIVHRAGLRWRTGQTLYASCEFKGYLAYEDPLDHHWFEWSVKGIRADGVTVDTLYTSGHIGRATLTSSGSEWTRFQQTGLAWAAATPGAYHQVYIHLHVNDAGDSIETRRGLAQREVSATPAVGWPSLVEWAEGDEDIGATNLNKLSTGLTALYTAGVEALFPEIPVTGGGTAFAVHAKPWLVYMVTGTNPAPKIWYGADNFSEYGLPRGTSDVWQSFDLTGVRQLPIGSRYIVEGVVYAVEADSAYVT